MGTRTHLICFR